MSDFYHLHAHSYFSKGDALPTPEELVEKAAELEQPAIALTDHGTMDGLIYTYLACKGIDSKHRGKVSPIMGCEFYCAEDADEKTRERFHLLVIAKNWEGYKAMVQLTRFSHQHHYYRSRIDRKLLTEFAEAGLTKDLIVTSACPLSWIDRAIIEGDQEKLDKEVEWHKKTFPNFYIELMDHNMKGTEFEKDPHAIDDDERVKRLVQLAKDVDLPIVLSNDVHFCTPDDAFVHHAFMSCMGGQSMADRSGYGGHGYHMRTEEEMREVFKYTPEGFDLGMAGLRDIYEQTKDFTSPYFFTGEGKRTWQLPDVYPGKDHDKVYIAKVKKGMREKVDWKSMSAEKQAEYTEWINNEISVFVQSGFSKYLLKIANYIHWAKHLAPCEWMNEDGTACSKTEVEHEGLDHPYFGILVGPGRGSACGCLSAYLLDITDVDPIEYGLDFTRFLDMEKVKYDVPDVDTDFQDNRRDEVINDYVVPKYGSDNAIHIAAYGKMQEAAAIKAACTALSISFVDANRMTSALDLMPGKGIDKIRAFFTYEKHTPAIKRAIQEAAKVPGPVWEVHDDDGNYIRDASSLEHLTCRFYRRIKTISQHAAGVIIAPPGVLSEVDHNNRAGKKGDIVLGFDYRMAEKCGLVKDDFLGLRNLRTIQEARKQIWRNHEVDVWPILQAHRKAADFNDEKVFKQMEAGNTIGVFQMEGSAAQQLCKALKPSNFDEMVDINVLIRPGTAGLIPEYKAVKFDGKETGYKHPILREITQLSKNMILYEEQALQIGRRLCGWDMGMVTKLKKAIKYGSTQPEKSKEAMEELREPFMEGGLKGGAEQEELERVYEGIAAMAVYSFNRSHTVAYTITGYYTAWLKAHYPVEYHAALLSTTEDDENARYLSESKRMGIEILPPDINESDSGFTASKSGQIRYGLASIAGIKDRGVQQLYKGRPFTGWDDFEAWYNGELPKEEAKTRKKCDRRALNSAAKDALFRLGAFDSIIPEDPEDEELAKALAKAKKDRAKAEMELIGAYITVDPLGKLGPHLKEVILNKRNLKVMKGSTDGKIMVAGTIESLKEHKAKNGLMAFIKLKLEDQEWEVTLFADVYAPLKEKLKGEGVLLVKGTWQAERGKILGHAVFTGSEYEVYIDKTLAEREERALATV